MQTYVSEHYALEAWEMQLVFSKLLRKCRFKVHIQNGQNVRPKNTQKCLLSIDTGIEKSFMCVHDAWVLLILTYKKKLWPVRAWLVWKKSLCFAYSDTVMYIL